MKTIGIVITILVLIILAIVCFFLLKPYFIKHDTTILFTGGLGSGKTLESVKRSIILIRKNRFFKWKLPNLKAKIQNLFIKWQNKARARKYQRLIKKGLTSQEAYIKCGKLKPYVEYRKKPLLYSNIPVHFKPHLFSFKREWSTKLQVKHVLLLKEINEFSVVLIDEFPQFVSQFDWDIPLVQKNANEFITFFRHYIGGHLIINAQSPEEIECHFRRKLNIGIWCFDCKVWPFPFLPLFYTNRMCDYMISDNVTTMSTTYVEDNTKLHFGLFPWKAYDSRCYRPRYKKVHIKIAQTEKWQKLTTVEILTLRKYISPLDTKTTEQQIKNMEIEAEELERNKDNENRKNRARS